MKVNFTSAFLSPPHLLTKVAKADYGEIEKMLVREPVWEISEVLRLFKFEVCSDLARRQLELNTELKCSFNGMGVVVQFDGTQV